MLKTTQSMHVATTLSLAIGLAAFVLYGCEQGRQLGLLGGATPPRTEANPSAEPTGNAVDDKPSSEDLEKENDRLRKLMAVRIAGVDDDAACTGGCAEDEQCLRGDCVPQGETAEIEDADIAGDMVLECNRETILSGCGSVFETCSACYGRVLLCIANRLLDVSGLRSSPLEVHNFDGELYYRVPQQSTASNVSLSLLARNAARDTLDVTLYRLYATGAGLPQGCPDYELTGLSQNLVDALQLYEEATEVAGDNILAASDEQLASTPSLSEAAARAVAGGELSRASAAHLVVGGDPGLLGTTSQALCDDPRLTPQARRAVSVFRHAAISPSDLLDDNLAIDDLLESSLMPSCNPAMGDYLGCGSVRQRLNEFYGAGLLSDIEDLEFGDGTAGVLGLRREDFEQARSYLAQEITTFNRTRSELLPPRDLIGNTQTSYPRFAGMASSPPVRDPAYWAALAAYDNYDGTGLNDDSNYISYLFPLLGAAQGGTAPSPASGIAQPGAAQIVSFAYLETGFIKRLFESSTVPEAARDSVLQILTPLVMEGVQRQVGVIGMARGASDLRFLLTRALLGRDIRVIVGEDALECATTGFIEGAECTTARLDSNEMTLVSLTTPDVGSSYIFTVSNPSWPQHILKRLYVVEKQGQFYEPLAVFNAPNLAVNGTAYTPVFPEALERTGTVLRPSTEWCTRSEVSCAGEKFDARLPLEDELSSDNDDVESSWRHYLTLARQAADEADLLGDSVLDLTEKDILRTEAQQLAQIQRAEQAVQELQETCGISVDPTDILRRLSTDGTKDFNALRGGPDPEPCVNSGSCTGGESCIGGRCMLPCDTGTDCGTGNVCVDGVCSLDPLRLVSMVANGTTDLIDRANAERLWECIGDDAFVDFATLGNQELCIWQDSGNPNLVCEGSTSTSRCPVPAVTVGSCSSNPNRPAGTTGKTVDTLLGVFDGPPKPGLNTSPCAAVRALRKDPGLLSTALPPEAQAAWTQLLIQQIRQTNIYHPDRLPALLGALGWRAEYGGYSAITLHDEPVYETGSTERGAPNVSGPNPAKWPCDARSVPDDCGSGPPGSNPSMFCQTIDCSDPEQREAMNDRMLRATLAAVETSLPNKLPKNFVYPVYYYNAVGLQPPSCTVAGLTFTPCPSYGLRNINTAPMPQDHTASLYGRLRAGANFRFTATNPAIPLLESAISVGQDCREVFDSIKIQDTDPNTAVGRAPEPWRRPDAGVCGQATDYVYDIDSVNALDRTAWYVVNEFDTLTALPVTTTGTPSAQGASQSSDLLNWKFGLDSQRQPPLGAVQTTAPACVDDGCFSVQARVFANMSEADPLGEVGWYYSALTGGAGGFTTLDNRSFGLPPMPNPYSSPDYLRIPIMAPYVREGQALLDGLDLICEVAAAPTTCPEAPPEITGVGDVDRARRYLECLADQIEEVGSNSVLVNVPTRVIERIRQQGSTFGTSPATGGTFSERTNDLLAAIRDLSSTIPTVASIVRQLSFDVDRLHTALARSADRKRLASQHAEAEKIELEMKRQLDQVNHDMGLMGSLISTIGSVASLNVVGAASSLLNVAEGEYSSQIVQQGTESLLSLTNQIESTEVSIIEHDVDDALTDFNSSLNLHSRELFDMTTDLVGAITRMHGALAAIENERQRGRRAFYRAMLMDTDSMAAQYEATLFMRTRLTTARIRYEAALKSARRMAFLARRAIEQRLGQDLSSLQEPLPLVEAPSTWVDSVCSTTGTTLADRADQLGKNFADAYIGDYVTRLENVVESYRLVNNFHEGSDTAVVSLRDDIKRVRTDCATPVDNLLYHSGELTSSMWQVEGCPDAELPDGGLNNDQACVGVLPIDDGPFPATWPAYGRTSGYSVTFGHPDNAITDGACSASDCFVDETTRIFQPVSLLAGRYRLSWYGRAVSRPEPGEPDGLPSLDPADAVRPRIDGEELDEATGVGQVFIDAETFDWNRYYLIFDLREDTTVDIELKPVLGEGRISQQVDITGLMLENLNDEKAFAIDEPNPNNLPAPKAYMNTGEDLTAILPTCEDTEGTKFRLDNWTRSCVRLCDDGLRENCALSGAQVHCYRETTLSLSQRDIDDGRILNLSGFARGNFNYRIASIGLNFVGQGTRNCESSSTPSTCFAGGFVPYSIEHMGPYFVRNYDGSDYEARLFTGRIEHARGLAAERYLTNPISSADNTLIGPYLRNELNGRPLDGTFVLRVWEEPGIDFEAIEDVQFVLNYRYWTRFN